MTTREETWSRLTQWSSCDLLVIGGGATGLGVALEAVSRGYKTVLVERGDFASSTSGLSTKLIHGGVRYLEAGDLPLVREALKERNYLLSQASDIVTEKRFVIPGYRIGEVSYYRLGLGAYDVVAGKTTVRKSARCSKAQILKSIPNLRSDGLRGGVRYSDGQFDDALLAVNLAGTIIDHGGIILNYCAAESLIYHNGQVAGAWIVDRLTDNRTEISASAVVNATGIFADELMSADDADHQPVLTFSRGTHIVFSRSFFDSETALLIPKTDDGRILFCIPWKGRVVAGTTDVEMDSADATPVPERWEIDYLLKHLSRYLSVCPDTSDVLSVFSGTRPLVRKTGKRSSRLSRRHQTLISRSGLISLVGGKWTTFRKMGSDAVNAAIGYGHLKKRPGNALRTPILLLSNYDEMNGLSEDDILNDACIHEIELAVNTQQAHTVEDVLARRSRLLYLDARAAGKASSQIAQVMASMLGKDTAWITHQTTHAMDLAARHLPEGIPAE